MCWWQVVKSQDLVWKEVFSFIYKLLFEQCACRSLPQLAVCLPQLAVCLPQLAVCLQQLASVCSALAAACCVLAVCLPQLAVCLPQFAVCLPQPAVCLPQPVVCWQCACYGRLAKVVGWERRAIQPILWARPVDQDGEARWQDARASFCFGAQRVCFCGFQCHKTLSHCWGERPLRTVGVSRWLPVSVKAPMLVWR